MKRKAVIMLSGGLDSQLALKIMQNQGLDIYAIHFYSAFHVEKGIAEKSAKKFGVPIKSIDITDQLLAKVKNPKHGHGSGLNPCVDCRIIGFGLAKEYMKEIGADFVITGEVLGSRPMSQRMQPLKIIEGESGLAGYIVRPLCARLLSPSIPEEKGWVDREKLFDIQGRSRKPQMALAVQLQIGDYPSPAGGCLLTEKVFSQRLGVLLKENSNPKTRDLYLLRVGRHFISSEGQRFIISRHKEDDEALRKLISAEDLILELKDYPGPTVLMADPSSGKETLQEAGTLLARFSKARDQKTVFVKYPQGEFEVVPKEADELEKNLKRI